VRSGREQTIFLTGLRGSGKSSVGALLAAALGLDFDDTDALVTGEAGKSVAAIVAEEGWEGFRRRESLALEAAARPGRVVATGGGMVLSAQNRALMRARGVVIYLAAPPATLVQRLYGEGDAEDAPGQRPSLTGKPPLEEMEAVFREREALYLAAAHHQVDATPPAHEVAEAIRRIL
jgi:shikimate kinase